MADNKYSVELTASGSGFATAWNRAAGDARKASDQIKGSVAGIKTAFAGLGVSLSIAGIGLFIKSSIDAADKLNDLAKATGLSATTIGGIGFAAQQAGTDVDGAAKAFGKFNLFLASAQAGNADAIETFGKLGLSIADLKSGSPEQTFYKVANSFASFEEGAQKAAGASLIFGKSYQSILPLLDEGGASIKKNIEYYERYSGVSEDLVRASDEFNDSITKLQLITKSFGMELARALLPSMQSLANYLLNARTNTDLFKVAADGVAGVLKKMATGAAYTVYVFKSLGDALAYNALLAMKLATADYGGAIDLWKERQANVAGYRAELKATLDMINAKAPETASGYGGAGQEGGIWSPGSLRRVRTPIFAKSGAAPKEVDEFTKALERAKEMAAEAQGELDALLSGEKFTAAEKALAKIAASPFWEKLNESGRNAIRSAFGNAADIEKQSEAVRKSVKEWEDQGKALDDAAEAGQKRVQAVKDEMAAYALQNQTMEREIALVGQDIAAHQKLAATIEYEIAVQRAKDAGMTESLAKMKADYDQRISLIDELAARIKQFNETEQIGDIFRDSFADSITDVVMGTKSISEAFKDMERNIVQAITRIASQNLAKAIFGDIGSGGPGGMFSWLAGLLGGSGGGLGWLSAYKPGGYASVDSSLMFGANGINFSPGGMTMVGERGPEIVNLPRGASVTPNHKLGGNVISINVNVPGGTSSASADRIAVMTGQAVNRALRRNA